MAKYKRRADGRYEKKVQIGYDPSSGRPKYKVLYGKTIKELDSKAAEFTVNLNKGIVMSTSTISLYDWATKWLEVYKSQAEYNTYAMYENNVRNHIKTSPLARMPMPKFKSSDIQAIINVPSAAGKARTAQITALTLKQIFAAAVDDHIIFQDPAYRIKVPKATAAPKRALEQWEKDGLTAAELSDQLRAIVYLGWFAGLRRGEVLALQTKDVNLKERKISVTKALVFVKLKAEGDKIERELPQIKPQPKTDKGFREVPITNDELYEVLQTAVSGKQPFEQLFTTQAGGLVTRSAWRRTIDRIQAAFEESTGLPADFTMHTFRHTYATDLYYAGVDVKTAQLLLGHNDIKVTLDIYTHLDELSKAKTETEKLRDYYKPKPIDEAAN